MLSNNGKGLSTHWAKVLLKICDKKLVKNDGDIGS